MAQNPVVTTGTGDTPQVAFNKINTDIGTLYSNVDTASNSASAASASAASANTSATTAATNAANAVNAVAAAQTAANQATTTANAAQSTATSAQSTANTANTNATTALTTANAIAATANAANTNATAAQTTANTAATNATSALNTANGISATATSALTAANSAQTQAASAVTTANAAQTTANSVATTATAAQTTANAAQTSANNAVTTANAIAATANAAQTTANTASTNASAAVTTANAVSTTANNALSTATTASTNATAAVNTANGIAATANTANTNASTALTTAGTASTNAATALSTANAISGTANAAKYVAGVNKVAFSQMYAQGLITAQAYPGAAVGGNSSRLALQQAINYVSAQYRATGLVVTLYIDAVYYIGILSDWTKPIFVEPNVSFEFAKGAYLITDNVLVPAFVFAYTYNVSLLNMHISYQGKGFPIDYTLTAPGQATSYLNCAMNFQTTLGNYMSAINAWASGTSYVTGNVVTYNGVIYIATASSTAQTPPGTAWTVYTGTTGSGPCADNRINIVMGTTPIWAGPQPYCAQLYFTGNTNNVEFNNLRIDVPPNPLAYSSTVNYAINNVVTYSGLYYIATTAGTLAAPPSTGWALYSGTGYTPNPPVALPNQFVPYAVSGYNNWQPNTTVNGSTETVTITHTCLPYQLSFINTVFDGVVMGWNGDAINGTIKGFRSYRYADNQNADGSQIGAMGGAISAYNAGTTYGKGFTASLSGTNYIYINTTATSGNSPPNATYWAVYAGTQGYPTSGPSSSPPHAFYLQDPDNSYYTANPLFTARDISDVYDYGIPCGFQQGRRANGGNNQCSSFKVPINNDIVIDNYTCLRPDGGVTVITYAAGNLYGSFKNAYIVYNSSLPVIADQQYINNAPYPGLLFPSAFPYVYMVLQNITIRDTAASTTVWPIENMSNTNNANCSMTGMKVYVANWAGTGSPGMTIAGTNMEFECQNFFNSYNATAQNVGVLTQGTALLQQSRVRFDIYGFRSPSIVWSAVPTGISGTMSSVSGGTTWPYNTNTYLINFSSGETRYGVFTNGSATVTWQMPLMGTTFSFATTPSNGATSATLSSTTNLGASGTMLVQIGGSGQKVVMNWVGTAATFASALTGTPTSAVSLIPTIGGATQTTASNAAGIVLASYSSYRNRISVTQPNNNTYNTIGAGTGNRIEVNDMTNGYYQVAENGSTKERWSMTWTGTPTAGATFVVPNMIVPSPAAVVAFTWLVAGGAPLNATGGAMTSVGVSLTNGTAITLTNGTFLPATLGITANTNTGNWPSAPVSAAGTQRNVTLTGNGGNFDGTGVVIITMVVEMQFATT